MQSSLIREQIINSLREGADIRLRLIDLELDNIIRASESIHRCFETGGKVLLFGNGGSAADAQHFAAEFVCRFDRDRKALPAIALTTDTSALTAIANDYGFDRVFARQIEALCDSRDVVIAISTSGQSPNVVEGVKAARKQGAQTIGLIGGDGGDLAKAVDVAIVIPVSITARIQECHIAVGHIICETVESLLNAGA
jgi:D-sedoheptulose 7-phosphate isomerase